MQTNGLGPVRVCRKFCLPPALITDPNVRLITTFAVIFFSFVFLLFFIFLLTHSSYLSPSSFFFFLSTISGLIHCFELFPHESRKVVSIVEFNGLFFASDAILRSIACSTRSLQISLVYYGNIPYNLAYF